MNRKLIPGTVFQMKEVTSFLIVVLLSSLGLQAEIWNEDPRSFKKGESYQFTYEAQGLSGLPKTSAEYQGFRIQSLVELTFETESKVLLVLKDFELRETIENIRTRSPYDFVSESSFKKVQVVNPDDFKDLLLPVRFNWDLELKITDFETQSKDSPLSVNIKRGILNMLNMNLKLKETNWKEESDSYHIQNEEGIEGVCSASYIWSSFPYTTSSTKLENFRTLTITRSKSANKCEEPAGYDQANFLVSESKSKMTRENRTFVKNMNEASLNVTVEKSKGFFVWEALSRSLYAIAPSDVLKESMSTYVVQSLIFKTKTSSTKPEVTGSLVKKSLVMEITKSQVKLSKTDMERIISLIEDLGNLAKNGIPELIRLLRQADDTDFIEISTKVFAIVKIKPEILKPYLDVLSEVLTFASAKSLINDYVLKPSDTINDDNQMALRIGHMAGLSAVEDTNLIDLLTTAASKPILLNNKYRSNTLKTTWLTIGSLAGSYYLRNPKYDIESTIKFFTKLVMDIKSTVGEKTKFIVILKALGNIGSLKAYPYLREIIKDKTQPLALRVQAVYSLRKIPRHDTKIELMLVSIYYDVNEDVELRLAAAVDVLLRYQRKLTIKTIVIRILQEPIKQVRAFIQDLIVQMAKVPELKKTFMPLLRIVKIIDYSREYSRIHLIPIKSGFMLASLIYTPDSLIPRTGNILLYDNRFGKRIMPLEIGFRFENDKNQKSPFKGFKEYFANTMKSIQSVKPDDLATMTVYYKRYDNEIAFWSMDSELVKMSSIEKFEDLIKFLQGVKVLNLNYNLNMIINGELHIPTTLGLKYSVRLNTVVDLKLNVDISKVLQTKTKSTQTKIEIKPSLLKETLFDVGIDAGYIKSEISSKISFVTPRAVWRRVLIDDKTLAFSYGFTKPKNDIHLIRHMMEKKFKITYYSALNDFNGVSKIFNITPFYVTEKDARKIKTKNLPFPFGMKLEWSYFCDVGKPRSDGHKMSLFSAGDAYSNLYIKMDKTSDFDEIRIEIKKEVFQSSRKYAFSINHMKNDEIQTQFDLVTVRLSFGLGNRVDISWPEKLDYIKDAIKFYSNDKKKPEIKYVKLTGSIKFPLPITFDPTDPLKIMTDDKKYGYGFTGKVLNSKDEVIDNLEIQLGVDKDAKELGEEISKRPDRYTHHKLVFRCSQDIIYKMPHSPACFNAWLNLNTFNQFKLSVNWTDEGFSRLKKMFNKLNQRIKMSQYLSLQKYTDNKNNYEMTCTLSPYFNPSTTAKISLSSLTNVYKYNMYTRTSLMKMMLTKFSKKRIDDTEKKICQIRKTANSMAINTFDNHYNNLFGLSLEVGKPDITSIIFVQDEENLFQITGIRTPNELIIQVLGKDLPLIRLIKTGDDIVFNVDKVKFDSNEIKVQDKTVATLNRITSTIYGDGYLYDINLPELNVRVLTDLDKMLDIEASINYRSTLRGICGDMNGEYYNEFKNADCTGTYNSPYRLFAKSDYLLKPTDINEIKYIPIKKCSQSTKLRLI